MNHAPPEPSPPGEFPMSDITDHGRHTWTINGEVFTHPPCWRCDYPSTLHIRHMDDGTEHDVCGHCYDGLPLDYAIVDSIPPGRISR